MLLWQGRKDDMNIDQLFKQSLELSLSVCVCVLCMCDCVSTHYMHLSVCVLCFYSLHASQCVCVVCVCDMFP